VGVILAALVSVAFGFLPLFAGPGYEQALVAGIVLPSIAAICAALDLSKAEGEEGPVSAASRPLRGLAYGLLIAFVAWIIAMLHGVRAQACAMGEGTLFFLLTAGTGIVLGGTWGGVASFFASGARRRKLAAVLFALSLPWASIALSVARYYDSPIIFAYDPFVGYFSGTLYDTIIDPGVQLYTHRLGSLGWLLFALTGLAGAEYHRRKLMPNRALPIAVRWMLAGLSATGAAIGLFVFVRGENLGHRASTAFVVKSLGITKSGPRCDVVAPKTEPSEYVDLLLPDCETSLARVEKFMGARGPARITAFFFRDAAQKKRYMGAFNTYVAKPWRAQVYIQGTQYPHPVLGHELAHVVAGSFGHGPFRIAGTLGGFLPDPGLIEGIAEAASPHDDEVTDLAWSRAMLDLNLLPAPSRLFSLGFLADASQKSYTVAGAFIAFVGDRYGMEKVRRWYGGESLPSVLGKTMTELDAEFRAHLLTLTVSDETREHARARFERPGVFGRKCPHVVDALRKEADECKDSARYEEAIANYGRVLSQDENDFLSRLSRATLEQRYVSRSEGRAELERIAGGTRFSRPVRDRANEAIADGEYLEGEFESAARRYDTLAASSLDEDFARTVEVKREAALHSEMRPLVSAILFGEGRRQPNPTVYGIEIGKAPRTALTLYLEGRQLVTRGYHARALATFDELGKTPLPTRRLARETLRLEAVAACAERDRARVAKLTERARTDPSFSPDSGKKRGLLAYLDSCIP